MNRRRRCCCCFDFLFCLWCWHSNWNNLFFNVVSWCLKRESERERERARARESERERERERGGGGYTQHTAHAHTHTQEDAMSWCNVRDARCGRSALEWWWQGHGKTKQNKKKLGSNSKTQQGTKRTCSKTVAKSDCCLEDSRVDAVLVQSPLGNPTEDKQKEMEGGKKKKKKKKKKNKKEKKQVRV